MRLWGRIAAVAVAAGACGAPATGSVTVWQGSMAGSRGTSADVTARMVVRISTGFTRLRVRLSNQFGAVPLRVSDVWVARAGAGGGPSVVPGSSRRVTFGGRHRVVIPPGATRWSDAAPLAAPSGAQVAVSIHAPGQPVSGKNYLPYPTAPTGLFLSSSGAHAADESGRPFASQVASLMDTRGDSPAGYYPGQAWWVDALAGNSAAAGTVVVLGDSISEGYAGYGPPGQRFSDILGTRLAALPPRIRMAVSNAAISGDTLTRQPNPYMPPTDPYGCCGVPILRRLVRDVTSMPGVRSVFLLAGTNDLGGAGYALPAPPERVINGYRHAIRTLHEDGIRVVGSTLIPMGLGPGNPREQARQVVNAWIRQRIGWDAIVDLDATMRDPLAPWRIAPAWASSGAIAPTGGVYHPNAAGHAAMAAAIPTYALLPDPTRTRAVPRAAAP